jgi:glycerol-3-phosphate dehydrogenase (NAD(P)+)
LYPAAFFLPGLFHGKPARDAVNELMQRDGKDEIEEWEE